MGEAFHVCRKYFRKKEINAMLALELMHSVKALYNKIPGVNVSYSV